MRRPDPRRIAATDDPVRLIQKLRDRAWRERTGLFCAEGARSLLVAAEDPATIHTLVVSWKLLQMPPARQTVRRLRRDGTRCVLVTPETFRSISWLAHASGVAMVLRQKWTPLASVDPSECAPWLVLRQVRSPGNLGTLLRSLSAVGGGGVVLLGSQPDPFDPAVVRAAMGALPDQCLVRTTSEALARHKRAHGYELIGTSPAAGLGYRDFDWRRPAMIFLGGERRGMEPIDAELCDRNVRIPMCGRTDSLNLGVAGSLLAYEVFHARRGS